MAFEHTLEGFSVNAEDACGGLLVAAGVRQHARYVTAFQLGKRRPVFLRPGARLSILVRGKVIEVSDAFGQIVRRDYLIAESRGAHDGVLKLAYVARPVIAFKNLYGFGREANG